MRTVRFQRGFFKDNVSKDDFENGATYLSLMEQNVAALKEALN